MWFLLGEGGFHNVFGDRPTKWPAATKKTIKTFVLWDAPQLIKLININHNKHLGSWKSSAKKCSWTKLRIKVLLKQWSGTKCAFKIFLEIAPS